MIDIIAKYQLAIFGNFLAVLPTPENFAKLMGEFKDKNFLPNTVQELSLADLQQPVMPPQIAVPELKLQLLSSNREWVLTCGKTRIDIIKNPTDLRGQNLGRIEDFTEEACDFINRIFRSIIKNKANRISLITSGLFGEMTVDMLNGIYNTIYKSISVFKDEVPFEWNSRRAVRTYIDILNHNEPINFITSINRGKYQSALPENQFTIFDSIELGFDINTVQENNEDRFDVDAIKAFCSATIELRNEVIDELKGIFNA